LRVLTLAYAILWTYAVVLLYLGTTSILRHETSIYLPLSSVTTTVDLFPFISLGILGMIIVNFYGAHLKKRTERAEGTSA
jgi:hypothetical protein